MDPELEQKISAAAKPYIAQGRPDWNIPHVAAAVYWMKELLKHEGGDTKILVTAIYLHDIGYAKVLNAKYTYAQNEAIRPDHMVVGEQLAREILGAMPEYSEAEIDEIAHLVRTHDELTIVRSHNEQLVYEADNLSVLDRERVKPNFDRANYLQWLSDFEKKRMPLFRTKTGLSALAELLPVTRAYAEKLQS